MISTYCPYTLCRMLLSDFFTEVNLLRALLLLLSECEQVVVVVSCLAFTARVLCMLQVHQRPMNLFLVPI